MSYLNRANGYQPTGQVNSEPSDTEPFESVMEPEPGDAEYPAPQPAHVRDGVSTAALGAPGEQHEVRRSDYVPAAVHQVLANRFQQERTAKRAAEEELEQARRLIGQGPFVIVKLGSLNTVTDQGQAEVKVGFGGGVTRHMLESVLSIGLQAVRESLPPGARAGQEDTVRLPEVGALFGVDAHGGTPSGFGSVAVAGCTWPEVQCTGHAQPAQKPQESTGTPDPRDVSPGY